MFFAVYEMADLWCPGISAEQYASFLEALALSVEWRQSNGSAASRPFEVDAPRRGCHALPVFSPPALRPAGRAERLTARQKVWEEMQAAALQAPDSASSSPHS